MQVGSWDNKPTAPPDWIAGLTKPLVYVTLGTVFNKKLGVFRQCIEALKDFPVETLLTVGEDVDPASLGDLPASVRVTRFIPQETILGHCALVVSHAGSGSMSGALAFGVPMVLLPQGADQLFNAQRCSLAGAATWLHPRDTTIGSISSAVATTLNDPNYAVRAQAVAAEMRRMATPEQALRRVEQLRANAFQGFSTPPWTAID